MAECPCPDCQGRRLRKESLAVTVGGLNIDDFTRCSVGEELACVEHLELTEQQHRIADQILKEIRSRLGFLQSVGLGYLTLSRSRRDPFRRREPAHPAGHPDRLFPHGRAVYSG